MRAQCSEKEQKDNTGRNKGGGTASKKERKKKKKDSGPCHHLHHSLMRRTQDKANQGMEMCTEWCTTRADTKAYFQAFIHDLLCVRACMHGARRNEIIHDEILTVCHFIILHASKNNLGSINLIGV